MTPEPIDTILRDVLAIFLDEYVDRHGDEFALSSDGGILPENIQEQATDEQADIYLTRAAS